MGRLLALLYGVVAYAFFFVVFLYAIGFVGNLYVGKSIDAGGTVGTGVGSVIVNMIALSIFALQHSIMARPEFKAVWTKIIPESIERSTYVVLSSAALALLFWMWQPFTATVWDVSGTVFGTILMAGFWFGWLFVLASTFQLDHFGLFGLAQVFANWKKKDYDGGSFRKPLFYRIVRHPIMLGFVIAFWCTPVMSQGHLLFAVVTTAYIWIALYLEERDLKAMFGQEYDDYTREVGKLIPKLKRPAPPEGTHQGSDNKT
jgi:protein-S-isoprenylcysteine O-methyltransferase Ste14